MSFQTQITHFNQPSFSKCKWTHLHNSALPLNWKLLKQGKLYWKQMESYFLGVLLAKQRDTCLERNQHIAHLHPCVSSVSHWPLCVPCLFCIYEAETSGCIRIIVGSPGSTVTDLADYFHAWQTFFSASSFAVIEHWGKYMLDTLSYNGAWQHTSIWSNKSNAKSAHVSPFQTSLNSL